MSLHQVDTITNAAGTSGPSYPNGQKGVINGSSAASGIIGELISNIPGSAGTITTSVTNQASIVLTAGDWDIVGALSYNGATAAYVRISLSTTSASESGTTVGYTQFLWPVTASQLNTAMVPRVSVSISSTTTYYLVARVDAGSGTTNSTFSARRMR